MCSAYLQSVATLNEGGGGQGKEKRLVEISVFYLHPILNILIRIKNTRLILLEMPKLFQRLFSRIVWANRKTNNIWFYAAVKDHLEPPLLKSSPLFTF